MFNNWFSSVDQNNGKGPKGQKGKGWRDAEKITKNILAAPAEILTGKNIYDAKMETNFGRTIGQGMDVTTKVGAAALPTVANLVVPGSGMAISAIQGASNTFLPEDTNKNKTNENWFAGAQALGQIGGMAASMYGGLPKQMDGGILPHYGVGGFSGGISDVDPRFGNYPKYHLAEGGQPIPQYEAEDSEVLVGKQPQVYGGGEINQIAQGMYKTNGNTHEQGGMPMSGGDYVFSNRLKPTKEMMQTLNIDNAKNKTFADIATKIGNKKSSLQKKFDKGDAWTKKALAPQLQEIAGKLADIQEMNEQVKQNKAEQGFNSFMKKYGRYLPKAADGISDAEIQLKNRDRTAENNMYVPPSYGIDYGQSVNTASPQIVANPYMWNNRNIPLNPNNGQQLISEKTNLDNYRGYPIGPNQGQQLWNNITNPVSAQRMQAVVPIKGVVPKGGSYINKQAQDNIQTKDLGLAGSIRETPLINNKNQKNPGTWKGSPQEVYDAMMLAQPLYNIAQGFRKIDKQSGAYNPMDDASLALMKQNLNYDINPQLAASQSAYATARNQIAGVSGGDRQTYMKGALAAARGQAGTDAGIYANREKEMADRRNTYAQALYQAGSDQAAAEEAASQANAQAYAARRDFVSKGLASLGEYAANKSRASQGSIYDKMMMAQMEKIYGTQPQTQARWSMFNNRGK